MKLTTVTSTSAIYFITKKHELNSKNGNLDMLFDISISKKLITFVDFNFLFKKTKESIQLAIVKAYLKYFNNLSNYH